MSENFEQKNDVTESWQETPYVSRFTPEVMKELARPDLKARVAIKSFAVVCIGLLISAIASYSALPHFNTLYTMFPFFYVGSFCLCL